MNHTCGCATFGPGPHPVDARHPNVRGCEHAEDGLIEGVANVCPTCGSSRCVGRIQWETCQYEYAATLQAGLDVPRLYKALLLAVPGYKRWLLPLPLTGQEAAARRDAMESEARTDARTIAEAYERLGRAALQAEPARAEEGEGSP